MPPGAVERENVSLVGYHDLEDRPAFKIALKQEGSRWYCYLAHFWHPGWSILDVTDPHEPELVNFVEGPPNTMTLQIQIADDTMVTSLERPRAGYGPVDDKMDPADPYEEGMYVWDLEDPVEPELLGHLETGGSGTHRNFYNGGDYVYANTKFPDLEGANMSVVDISDRTDPEVVHRFWWPGQAEGEEQEMRGAPKYFHGPAYVEGDRAYLSYGLVGVVTLDVSDPTEPELVNRLELGDIGAIMGCHSAIPVPGTDLLSVCTETVSEELPTEGGDPLNPVFLVDASDEREPAFTTDPWGEYHGPKIISTLPLPHPEDHLPYDNYYEKGGRFGPHNFHHFRADNYRYESSDYLPTTYFNAGVRLFDISDPLAPTEAGYYVPDNPEKRIGTRPYSELVTHSEDIVVDERGYMYVSDTNHGLHILESDLL